MVLGRLLVARCEQKEFKIDASVVAPEVAGGRGRGAARPAAAALHASTDQRTAGPVQCVNRQRPAACNSKTSKRCSTSFGSGQIYLQPRSHTTLDNGEEVKVDRLDQQEDGRGWVRLI
jgi:hypothetical protein